MRPKHPLLAWIEKQTAPSGRQMTPLTFAQEYGFTFRTIYYMVDQDDSPNKNRKPVMPRLDTLKRIETATGGEVTIRQCLDWYDAPAVAES